LLRSNSFCCVSSLQVSLCSTRDPCVQTHVAAIRAPRHMRLHNSHASTC
jgi:hypothetical protein